MPRRGCGPARRSRGRAGWPAAVRRCSGGSRYRGGPAGPAGRPIDRAGGGVRCAGGRGRRRAGWAGPARARCRAPAAARRRGRSGVRPGCAPARRLQVAVAEPGVQLDQQIASAHGLPFFHVQRTHAGGFQYGHGLALAPRHDAPGGIDDDLGVPQQGPGQHADDAQHDEPRHPARGGRGGLGLQGQRGGQELGFVAGVGRRRQGVAVLPGVAPGLTVTGQQFGGGLQPVDECHGLSAPVRPGLRRRRRTAGGTGGCTPLGGFAAARRGGPARRSGRAPSPRCGRRRAPRRGGGQ